MISRLRALGRVVMVAAPLGLAGGCFEETGAGGGSDGGDGGECPEGSPGCDCYGNETCDGELECNAGKCFEPGCTPGEERCQCNDGLCLGGLMCEDGVCLAKGGGTDGGDGGTASGDGGDGGDDAGTSDGGTDGNVCDSYPLPDDECTACMRDQCCPEFEDCVNEDACLCTMECILAGGDPIVCGPDCGPSDVFPRIDACSQGSCVDACGGPDTCMPPAMAPPCTVCAAQACCFEFEHCVSNMGCGCLEACFAVGGTDMECYGQCPTTPQAQQDWDALRSCSQTWGCMAASGQPCYAG